MAHYVGKRLHRPAAFANACPLLVGFSYRRSALCALIGTKAINKPLMSMTKRAAAMIVADLMASLMTPTLHKSRRLQRLPVACRMTATSARR